MRKSWTPDEEAYLCKHYATMITAEIAAKLGRSLSAVFNHARLMRLKKDEQFKRKVIGEFLTRVGEKSRFEKGYIPWNKGLHYNPVNNNSRFKPGNRPHGTKHDGAITIRKDHSRQYKSIRIAEGVWKPLHVKVWEDVNGPVPAGCIVVMKNKSLPDPEHIENLELLTRAENMRRNSITKYPPELREAIMALNKLKKTIREKDIVK